MDNSTSSILLSCFGTIKIYIFFYCFTIFYVYTFLCHTFRIRFLSFTPLQLSVTDQFCFLFLDKSFKTQEMYQNFIQLVLSVLNILLMFSHLLPSEKCEKSLTCIESFKLILSRIFSDKERRYLISLNFLQVSF